MNDTSDAAPSRSGKKNDLYDDRQRKEWAGRAPRLFVEFDLGDGAILQLSKAQAHYLGSVLRLKTGANVLLFNGRDGEWRAEIAHCDRRSARLNVCEQTRTQPRPAEIELLFAPLKHARLDYMVQKATEMGVAAVRPVITRRTVTARVKLDRMKANVIEAAEQCGNLCPPEVHEPQKLPSVLAEWPEYPAPARHLVFADETASSSNPAAVLAQLKGQPLSILIGPEGGFDETERRDLLARHHTIPISLGPRILRADTAAIVALTLCQAHSGDWTTQRAKAH